jgi:hypothetical protein
VIGEVEAELKITSEAAKESLGESLPIKLQMAK